MTAVKIGVSRGSLECALANEKGKRAVLFAPGFAQDARDYRFDPLVSALTNAGFAMLRMNYRHVAARAPAEESTITQMVDDMRSAVEFLKAKYASVGIVAVSLSSSVFLLSEPDVKAAVLWGPPLLPESKGRLNVKENLGLKVKEIRGNGAFLRDADVKRANALVVHGGNDQMCPPENGVHLASVLGTSVHVVEGADHLFTDKKHNAEAVRTTVEFLDKNV